MNSKDHDNAILLFLCDSHTLGYFLTSRILRDTSYFKNTIDIFIELAIFLDIIDGFLDHLIFIVLDLVVINNGIIQWSSYSSTIVIISFVIDQDFGVFMFSLVYHGILLTSRTVSMSLLNEQYFWESSNLHCFGFSLANSVMIVF